MRVEFGDLFDGCGSAEIAYSERAAALSGIEIDIRGWLVALHGVRESYALVDSPGACPECSPVPVAAIDLPGFRAGPSLTGPLSVRLQGRLSYGFAIDAEGQASFLRLEQARVCTGLAHALRGGRKLARLSR